MEESGYTNNISQDYNVTAPEQRPDQESSMMIGIAIILGSFFTAITAVTILGNALVILAVAVVKGLRNLSNYLIVSLAVSDLLVGLVVMPLSIVYNLTGRWQLGYALCSTWVSLDVMLCTASIYNMLMISIDRYLVITYPFTYAQHRSWKNAVLCIFIAWSSSILTGAIPLMVGWNVQHSDMLCVINQNIGYQVYATVVGFYLPLLIMIALYGRIFCISSRLAAIDTINRPAEIDMEQPNILLHCVSIPDSIDGKVNSNTSESEIPNLTNLDNNNAINNCSEKPVSSHHAYQTPLADFKDSHGEHPHTLMYSNGAMNGSMHNGVPATLSRISRYSDEIIANETKPKRRKSLGNRQAIKTLGIIMGLFTACWLPFFILAVIASICNSTGGCTISDWLTTFLTWLGYFNSSINPLIYARYTREFRTPFRELICCRWRTINELVRHEEYEYKYGR